MDSRNLPTDDPISKLRDAANAVYVPVKQTLDALLVLLIHANDCEPHLKKLRAGVDKTRVMLQDPHSDITAIDDFFNALSDEFMVLKGLMNKRREMNLIVLPAAFDEIACSQEKIDRTVKEAEAKIRPRLPTIDHIPERKNKLIAVGNTLNRDYDALVKKQVQYHRNEFSDNVAKQFNNLANHHQYQSKIKLTELANLKQATLPKLTIPQFDPIETETYVKLRLDEVRKGISIHIGNAEYCQKTHARLIADLPNQETRYKILQTELDQIDNEIEVRLKTALNSKKPPPPNLNVGQIYYKSISTKPANTLSVHSLVKPIASLKV